MYKSILFLFLLFTARGLHSQADEGIIMTGADSVNNYIISYLENHDVGFLWDGGISQDERIGFIGDSYERIRVHFNSVIQNYDNPFEYFVYGKTAVKDNICEFQGSLYISEISANQSNSVSGIDRAYLAGDYVFFENNSCLHSGVFRGEFICFVYVGADSTLYYDDIDAEDPSFANNLFTGEWYHYESDLVQVCNWGDRRIPGSGDLDIGKDSFQPSFRFLDNGWKAYLEEKENGDSEELNPWWE